jgi:hypothetical protein
MRRLLSSLIVPVLLAVSGCDMLGVEPASAVAARKEAEGKAVGGACRHAGRAIEDCYALNRKADKAAVFAGWREMNDYMRENKIDTVPAQAAAVPPPDAAPDKKAAKGEKAAKAGADGHGKDS